MRRNRRRAAPYFPMREKAEPRSTGWRRVGEIGYLAASAMLVGAGAISVIWSGGRYLLGLG